MHDHSAIRLVVAFLCATAFVSATVTAAAAWAPPDRSVERAALIDFYNATGGPSWVQPWNISASVDHCSWAGVCCTPVTWDPTAPGRVPGYNCSTTAGSVVELSFYAMNLVGTIPESFGNLTALLEIEIRSTPLGGPLPASMSRLTGLRYLDLSLNSFESPIPDLSNAIHLNRILLTGNKLSGSISNTTFPHEYLETFSVEGNSELTGILPFGWLKRCALLQLADFSNTKMQQPTLDISPLTFLPDYKNDYPEGHYICDDIWYPPIYATIVVSPAYFYYQTCICYQYLGGTPPNCTIDLMGALNSLYFNTGGPHWTVQTGWTALTTAVNESAPEISVPDAPQATVPNYCAFYGICCGDLRLFNEATRTCNTTANGTVVGIFLAHNNLFGKFPGAIGFFNETRTISVGENILTGSIPYDVWNLPELRVLNMSYNQFEDAWPISSNTPNLEELYLMNNHIYEYPTGTLYTWKRLRKFYFDYNTFESELTSDVIQAWSNLEELSMTNCFIVNELPANLFQLKNISFINLRSNRISGTIPATFADNSAINLLALGSNQLTGTIPPSIGSLKSVEVLDLTNNSISGSLPSSLSGLTELRFLLLQYNQLSGNVSTSNLPVNLTFLDVSSNIDISGDIPFNYIKSDPDMVLFNMSGTHAVVSKADMNSSLIFHLHQHFVSYGRYSCPPVTMRGAPSMTLQLDISPYAYRYANCVCNPGHSGTVPECVRNVMPAPEIAGIACGVLGAVVVVCAIVYYVKFGSKKKYSSIV